MKQKTLQAKRTALKGNEKFWMYFYCYLRSILIPVILWAIVWWIMSSFIDYEALKSPFLAPPSITFPIVWTILYVLMWVSHWILDSNNKMDKKMTVLYYSQLLVNALWSIFFFVLKWRLFSFIWIVLLDVLVIWMVIEMYKRKKIAGVLQIPYILWILFATYLTLAFYLLNG